MVLYLNSRYGVYDHNNLRFRLYSCLRNHQETCSNYTPGFVRILSQLDHLVRFIIMQSHEVFQVWLRGLVHDHLILVRSSIGFYN